MMFKILETLGCKIKKNNGKIIVDSRNINNYEIPENLMREMRSSVIIAGALLSRKKKVIFTYPGGCDIGARPIDLHIKAFEKLGINVKEEFGYINCETDDYVVITQMDAKLHVYEDKLLKDFENIKNASQTMKKIYENHQIKETNNKTR